MVDNQQVPSDFLSSLSGGAVNPAGGATTGYGLSTAGLPAGGDPLAAISGQAMQTNPLVGLILQAYQRKQFEANADQAARREAAGAMMEATRGSYGSIVPGLGAGLRAYNQEYDSAVKTQQLEQLKYAQFQQNVLKQQEMEQYRRDNLRLRQRAESETEAYRNELLKKEKSTHWRQIVQPDNTVVEYNLDTGQTRETGLKARQSVTADQGHMVPTYGADPNDPTGIGQVEHFIWVKPGDESTATPKRAATVTDFLYGNRATMDVADKTLGRLDKVLEDKIGTGTFSGLGTSYRAQDWPIVGAAIGSIGDSAVQGWSGITDEQKQNMTDLFADVGRLRKDVMSIHGAGGRTQKIFDDFAQHIGNYVNSPAVLKSKVSELRQALQDEQDIRLGRTSGAAHAGAERSAQPDNAPETGLPANVPPPPGPGYVLVRDKNGVPGYAAQDDIDSNPGRYTPIQQ